MVDVGAADLQAHVDGKAWPAFANSCSQKHKPHCCGKSSIVALHCQQLTITFVLCILFITPFSIHSIATPLLPSCFLATMANNRRQKFLPPLSMAVAMV